MSGTGADCAIDTASVRDRKISPDAGRSLRFRKRGALWGVEKRSGAAFLGPLCVCVYDFAAFLFWSFLRLGLGLFLANFTFLFGTPHLTAILDLSRTISYLVDSHIFLYLLIADYALCWHLFSGAPGLNHQRGISQQGPYLYNRQTAELTL
jgi:hypothetical protein